MEEEWFIINNISEFTDKVRAIVFNNFGSWDRADELDALIDSVRESDQEEFDKLLSHQESLLIVKESVKLQVSKNKKRTRYTLNDKIFADVLEKLNSRMVSNILNGLVQKGLVDMAYDEESNDFVFWIKDDDQNNKDKKPKTN